MNEAIVWTARIGNLQRHQKCLPATHMWSLSNRSDCRPSFLASCDHTLRQATGGNVGLMAPFQYQDKTRIAKLAHRLGVPIERTWSCYKGGIVHCGKCGTCTERIEALYNAELADLTEYAPESYEETIHLLRKAGKIV